MHFKSYCAIVASGLLATVALAGEQKLQDLTDALSGVDREACLQAADALGDLGADAESAIPALVEALKNDDPEICWHVCRALGYISAGADQAIPALQEALGNADPKVRAYAAYALGQLATADSPAVDALLKTVFDEEALVRRASLRAIRQIDPPQDKTLPIILRFLEQADPSIIMPALSTLAEDGKEAVPRLREALKHERACYWACLVLAEIGADAAEAVPELKEVLAHQDPDVRIQALLALGEIGRASEAVTPVILDVLEKDAFPQVRVAAAYALAHIDAEGEADEEALKKLLKSEDPFLQMVSAWALAQLQPDNEAVVREAVQLIVKALSSEDPVLQSGAARALAEFRSEGKAAAQALVEVLDESDPYVVGNAIDALAALGPEALDSVTAALKEPEIRRYAVRVIYRMGPDAAHAVPAAIEALRASQGEADAEFRQELQYALAAIGPSAKDAVPDLMKSVDAEDEEVRGSAYYALGKIGPDAKAVLPKLRNQLIEMVTSDDLRERRLAVWVLLKVFPGNQRLEKIAVPLLIQALQSERDIARMEACLTLGDLGEIAQPAVELIKKLLDDESPAVRQAAAEALARLES